MMKKIILPAMMAMGMAAVAHADFAAGSHFYDDVPSQSIPSTWKWKDFTLSLNWGTRSVGVVQANNPTSYSSIDPAVVSGGSGVSPNSGVPLQDACPGSAAPKPLPYTAVTFQFQPGLNITLSSQTVGLNMTGSYSVYERGGWVSKACTIYNSAVINSVCVNGTDCQQQ